MSSRQLLAILAAVTLVAGLLLVWSGLVRRDTGVRRRHASPLPALAGLGAACVIFALSGWVLPALVIAGGAYAGARRWVAGTRGDNAGVERVEALASWVENVRDVLQAGNQPVGAIGVATETCPPVIRSQARALYARLSAGQVPEVAFRRFADEMDDPLADLVAVGLLIAVSRGAETHEVLSALAGQARHQADRRRIVEAERAPMRREVVMVSAVMCVLLGAVFVFGRNSYLDAYDAAGGQLFLAAVLVGYVALLIWVARLARFPRPARFLTLRPEQL